MESRSKTRWRGAASNGNASLELPDHPRRPGMRSDIEVQDMSPSIQTNGIWRATASLHVPVPTQPIAARPVANQTHTEPSVRPRDWRVGSLVLLARPGWFADLVVFDPRRIADHATYERPHLLASGVVQVLVNGVPVLRDGKHTGATPGRFLRGPGGR